MLSPTHLPAIGPGATSADSSPNMTKCSGLGSLSGFAGTLLFLFSAQRSNRFLSLIPLIYFTVSAADAKLDSIIVRGVWLFFSQLITGWGRSGACWFRPFAVSPVGQKEPG